MKDNYYTKMSTNQRTIAVTLIVAVVLELIAFIFGAFDVGDILPSFVVGFLCAFLVIVVQNKGSKDNDS